MFNILNNYQISPEPTVNNFYEGYNIENLVRVFFPTTLYFLLNGGGVQDGNLFSVQTRLSERLSTASEIIRPVSRIQKKELKL